MDPAQIHQLFARLRAARPRPTTELRHLGPFELLVAVILSAQSTDKKVNEATERLFAVANTPQAMLELGEAGLKGYIKTIGLYNNKAANLRKTCALLLERHGGEVPRDRAALEALPGVGRKTANVVRSVAFDLPGLPVDTHVGRLSRLLGLTTETDPVKVEHELNAMIPAAERGRFSLRLILHGRRVCVARRPRCEDCVLNDFCPSSRV